MQICQIQSLLDPYSVGDNFDKQASERANSDLEHRYCIRVSNAMHTLYRLHPVYFDAPYGNYLWLKLAAYLALDQNMAQEMLVCIWLFLDALFFLKVLFTFTQTKHYLRSSA